jgi:hypothetical protein
MDCPCDSQICGCHRQSKRTVRLCNCSHSCTVVCGSSPSTLPWSHPREDWLIACMNPIMVPMSTSRFLVYLFFCFLIVCLRMRFFQSLWIFHFSLLVYCLLFPLLPLLSWWKACVFLLVLLKESCWCVSSPWHLQCSYCRQ